MFLKGKKVIFLLKNNKYFTFLREEKKLLRN